MSNDKNSLNPEILIYRNSLSGSEFGELFFYCLVIQTRSMITSLLTRYYFQI